MQPHRLGRVLGIGARVAGNKLREQADRLAAAPPQAPAPSRPPAASNTAAAASRTIQAPVAQPVPSPRVTAASAASASRRFARGAGRFGEAFFRPFAHATSVLWNQIAGIFFAMFTLFFFEHTWQIYRAHGLRDGHLLVYAAFALLFAWFTISSFWRAYRKQRPR